jgi:hypothetical protein
MKNIKASKKGTSKWVFMACLMTISLLITAKIHAQIPYRAFTDGCSWSVSDEKYMTMGDTVINGVSYMKVYVQRDNQPFEFSLSDAQYFTAIRDDSVNKKVYCNMPAGTMIFRNGVDVGQTEVPQEFLLYDYSLAVGETVTFYVIYIDRDSYVANEGTATRVGYLDLLYGVLNDGQSTYTSDDTLIHMSDGTPHKIISLDVNMNYYTVGGDIWIEGIGAARGFSNGFFVNQDFPDRRLLCFTNAEGATYQTRFDLDDNPDDCFNRNYASGIADQRNGNFTLYPNPANNTFTINFTNTQENVKQVRVMDMLGKVVMSVENPSSNTINIAKLPASIYAVQVQRQSGETYSVKLVKE